MAESSNRKPVEGAEGLPSARRIFVIDELQLRAGQLDAFLEALEVRYRPGAEERGQSLLQVLVSPPTRTLDVPQSVTLLWQLEGVAGFWGARSRNATEEVVGFWADCDARWVASRTRRLAAPPDALPSLDAAGRVNA